MVQSYDQAIECEEYQKRQHAEHRCEPGHYDGQGQQQAIHTTSDGKSKSINIEQFWAQFGLLLDSSKPEEEPSLDLFNQLTRNSRIFPWPVQVLNIVWPGNHDLRPWAIFFYLTHSPVHRQRRER